MLGLPQVLSRKVPATKVRKKREMQHLRKLRFSAETHSKTFRRTPHPCLVLGLLANGSVALPVNVRFTTDPVNPVNFFAHEKHQTM